jgi:hypothetical protein
MTPKRETLFERNKRLSDALCEAELVGYGNTRSDMGPRTLKAIRAAVYAALPGKQRKRAYMDATLEIAVKAACRALRRRAKARGIAA